MSYPFVVSGDVQLLMASWAKSAGFELPDTKYFKQMADQLCRELIRIFKYVDYIDGEELSGGLSMLLSRYSGTTVSLDRVYIASRYTLDMSRHVDINKKDVGIRSRSNSGSLLHQVRCIPKGDVALVDDVIYTGELLERVIKILAHQGTHVTHVFAGVGVGEGTSRIRNMGVEVSCVREYLSVIDEVCERDFYPGVPYSGRSLVGAGNTGVPYLSPWGDQEQWASIPASNYFFSDFCIQATIRMYKEIEKLSCKPVTFDKLGRQFPTFGHHSEFVVHILHCFLADKYDDTGILCH